MQEINTFPSFWTLSSPLLFVSICKPKLVLKRCLSPNSSSLKITYCDRPSTLLSFLCQHHVVHCANRKYMAVSCWGFFQPGRFPECAEGTWPEPISLPSPPPAWEQDRAEGMGCPNHRSGELQHAPAMGKQEARVLPRPSDLTGSSKQSPLPALKSMGNFEAECHCCPCKLYFTRGMRAGHSHCQISSLFCEWHQGDRHHMKEQITRMCPEFRACRERVERGSS